LLSGSAALVLASSVAARAQDEADVQAAARAFQEGQRAQLRGDAAEAARLYELADSIVGTPEALRSAIRSRLAAEHAPRAATLALAAQTRYPDDAETARLAQDVLEQLSGQLARIAVHCGEPCAVSCDGRAVATEAARELEFFVVPGAHGVAVRFAEHDERRETVDLIAGERRELRFAAPTPLADAAPLRAPEPASGAAANGAGEARATAREARLPPWVFVTAAGVTTVATGAALVSGLDTLDKRDAYRAAPTRARYERGVDSQVRTNTLLVSAGALIALTTGLAFFTDWDGEESLAPAVAASREGAVLTLKGSFQ
jgi:hypothetical protein